MGRHAQKGPGFVLSTKNPVLVDAGRRGAEKRWGQPKSVRIDDLTPEQAHLIRLLVDAARQSKADDSKAAA